MGNWRTVNISGFMDANEAKEMRQLLNEDLECENWDCGLSCLRFTHSLCGLGEWVFEEGTIHGIGNLAERDFDNDDIEKELKFLASKYHSINLTLHSGSDYENLTCSATFHVKDGTVQRCEPEVRMIEKIPQSLINARLMVALSGNKM